MVVKLFILGLPGSGKSAAAHSVEIFARMTGWTSHHFRDYPFLHSLFLADKEGKRFHSTREQGYEGFEVLDLKAYDEALQKLENTISNWKISNDDGNNIYIIEFARFDYKEAFNVFISHFSTNSFFLFIEADLATGRQRISERVQNPRGEDDHYVSDFTLNRYYEQASKNYATHVVPQLKSRYKIPDQNICVLANDHAMPEGDFNEAVKMFASRILLPQEFRT